jgi:hypothetical protein
MRRTKKLWVLQGMPMLQALTSCTSGDDNPVTDYLVLFTFLVPDAGGNYTELVEALSDNPDNVEQALHGVPPSTRPTVNCASTSSPAGADG